MASEDVWRFSIQIYSLILDADELKSKDLEMAKVVVLGVSGGFGGWMA